jgi:hypothetical protein
VRTAEDERIVEAAVAIRAELGVILGAEAVALDRELADLLDRATAGEDVVDRLLALLRRDSRTARWTSDYLYGVASADDAAGESGPRVEPRHRSMAEPPLPEAAADEPPPVAANGGGTREVRTRGLRGHTRRKPKPQGSTTADAYALLDCRPDPIVGQEFELGLGLSELPAAGVESDGPLKVPADDYDLVIDIHGEGFELRDGESWRLSIPVTRDDRYPRLALHLTPIDQAEAHKSRTIRATYSANGQIVGAAYRHLTVNRALADVATAPSMPPPPSVGFSVPTGGTGPDLTARIFIGEDDPSVLYWVLVSPWDSEVTIPADRYEDRIGDAKSFLGQLVEEVSAAVSQPGIYDELLGVGKRIAEHVPAEFWAALHAVRDKLQGPPSVLFLSEEPYVPWELAVLDESLDPDPDLPPFLGAQANVARWILAPTMPKQPPPRARSVASMAVVVGDYADSEWEELPEATAEAAALETTYRAAPIDARLADVTNLLKGTPKADLAHFAVHGQYDESAGRDGLIMVDGTILNGNKVLARKLDGMFVFLNACQVGAGNQVLGGAAGLAADFVRAGASGVVAPLWSVKDTIAREIAVEFYRQVLGDEGATPAQALRACRARFRDEPGASATYLAYQFFGGPGLRLTRGPTA